MQWRLCQAQDKHNQQADHSVDPKCQPHAVLTAPDTW